MTYFPYPDARPGRVGTGQASAVAFTIPADAVDYWADRLESAGADVERLERFGDEVLRFRDPDGLPLELVGREDAPEGHPPDGPVPAERAIRGFFGVTLSLVSDERTAELLERMGFEERESDGATHRRRFESSADLGRVVDLETDPQLPQGRQGAGTVHHVAYRTTADDHEGWREVLQDQGLRPTEIIDRKWFESVYVREHGGVLFEFATEGPGYTVDEDLEDLGSRLVLPEWLEDRRGEIEAGLPDLDA